MNDQGELIPLCFGLTLVRYNILPFGDQEHYFQIGRHFQDAIQMFSVISGRKFSLTHIILKYFQGRKYYSAQSAEARNWYHRPSVYMLKTEAQVSIHYAPR